MPRKFSSKAFAKKLLGAGKRMIFDPVTGKIVDLAQAQTVGKWRNILEKNKRLCAVCRKGPSVKPGYVHSWCARQVGEAQLRGGDLSDPKVLDQLGNRETADRWHLGLESAHGCGCKITWAEHTCEKFGGHRLDDLW